MKSKFCLLLIAFSFLLLVSLLRATSVRACIPEQPCSVGEDACDGTCSVNYTPYGCQVQDASCSTAAPPCICGIDSICHNNCLPSCGLSCGTDCHIWCEGCLNQRDCGTCAVSPTSTPPPGATPTPTPPPGGPTPTPPPGGTPTPISPTPPPPGVIGGHFYRCSSAVDWPGCSNVADLTQANGLWVDMCAAGSAQISNASYSKTVAYGAGYCARAPASANIHHRLTYKRAYPEWLNCNCFGGGLPWSFENQVALQSRHTGETNCNVNSCDLNQADEGVAHFIYNCPIPSYGGPLSPGGGQCRVVYPTVTPAPGGSLTLTWGGDDEVNPAQYADEKWAIRVDDETANGWRCNGPNPPADCCINPNPGDVCIDNLTANSYTLSVTTGHSYHWWVHGINLCGWSDLVDACFQVGGGIITPTVSPAVSPTPMVTPTMTLTPTPTPISACPNCPIGATLSEVGVCAVGDSWRSYNVSAYSRSLISRAYFSGRRVALPGNFKLYDRGTCGGGGVFLANITAPSSTPTWIEFASQIKLGSNPYITLARVLGETEFGDNRTLCLCMQPSPTPTPTPITACPTCAPGTTRYIEQPCAIGVGDAWRAYNISSYTPRSLIKKASFEGQRILGGSGEFRVDNRNSCSYGGFVLGSVYAPDLLPTWIDFSSLLLSASNSYVNLNRILGQSSFGTDQSLCLCVAPTPTPTLGPCTAVISPSRIDEAVGETQFAVIESLNGADFYNIVDVIWSAGDPSIIDVQGRGSPPLDSQVTGLIEGNTNLNAVVRVDDYGYGSWTRECPGTIPVTIKGMNAWFQTKEGDVHGANISSPIPGSCTPAVGCQPYFSLDGSAGTPGVVSYVNSANFGAGSVSSKGWLTKTNNPGMSFDYFYQLLGSPTQENWPSNFPATDPNGDEVELYFSSRTQQIGAGGWSINVVSGRKVILLVGQPGDPDNILVRGNITVAQGGFLGVIASGDIDVQNQVANVQGFFLAGQHFNTGEQGSTLNFQGTLYASDLMLERDLHDDNEDTPAEVFSYRPDFVINSPLDVWVANYTWQELPPEKPVITQEE
jgi:hypothetical protein